MAQPTITSVETEILRDGYRYLRDHPCPPPNDGSDHSVQWWTQTWNDGAGIYAKWAKYPLEQKLAENVLHAIAEYLELKAKLLTKGA